MKIEITQEDIKHGCRCDPSCDPVGRALSRAGIAHFGVLGTAVVVAEDNEHVLFLRLPEEVSEWILSFDRFEPVTPMSFELVLPAEHEEQPLAAAA
jgi:hypothetical protein